MIRVVLREPLLEACRLAADRIVERIRAKPTAVLGLATGSTPVLLYERLIERHRAGDVSFAAAATFNLDEYLGLAPSHPQSYRFFMDEHLFNRIDIPRERTHVLDGLGRNPNATCADYESAIAKAGGIDLQVLGIGGNGHIAFNEPGSPLDSRTRVVDLSADTIAANSDGRFFKDPREVPRQALSMGIGTILAAREIYLLATGEKKATAVRAAIDGPVDPAVPASALQRHPNVTFFLDRAAASLLAPSTYEQT